MKLEDAIEMVYENAPPLECPNCGAEELDFLAQYRIMDSAIQEFEWQCSNRECGCIFIEVFYRVKIEKVSD